MNLLITIPFLLTLAILIFYRKRIAWWEYILIILPSVLVIVILSNILKYSSNVSQEYVGDYAVKAKTERNNLFNNTYIAITASNDTLLIGEQDFMNLQVLWQDKNDEIYWDGNLNTEFTVTKSHTVVETDKSNLLSDIISDFQPNDDLLNDYPAVTRQNYPFPQKTLYNTYQRTLLGINNAYLEKKMSNINGKWGYIMSLRTYLIVFPDATSDYAKKQELYWNGGHDNEINICVGINTKDTTVTWSYVFGPGQINKISQYVNGYFNKNKSKNSLEEFPDYYDKVLSISSEWRPVVASTKISNLPITSDESFWILILAISLMIAIYIWIVTNKYNENNEKKNN